MIIMIEGSIDKMPEMEEIIVMTAEQWREYEIQTAKAEALERQKRWDKKHIEDYERRKYFCKQKILGAAIIIISLFLFLIPGNLFVLGSFGVVFGFIAIATKKMIVVNDYWWTHGGSDQW